ncbi:sigma-70 family RNA polymerase sigma factor [Polyangium sp. 15x6]|uniref:RNA polymerase sigma factor n=1 Tax=Polyangium sp. 15x6 TaxID=3042687 RepID=UPI00249A1BCD|nr:sigma-70 family RNA polymerase sigma factor [Polyangium sp. 15x6]MDI3290467.1 sigma-70 family RNA polymerase sigma factor [Polyangium sp. 15x6]
MTPQHVRSSSPFLELYQAYAAILPRWFRLLHLPERDVADAAQEVWIEVGTNPEQIPANAREARIALFKLAARVAARLRYRAAKAASRRGSEAPDELAAVHDVEERAAEALAVMAAVDVLDPQTRRLIIASKLLGYTESEIASREGLSSSAVKVRIWRTCAEISRRVRAHDERQDRRRGVLLLPGTLVIDPEIRAAMCAIWEAEGRLPSFGGPGGPGGPPRPPLPPPPPVVPAAPWFAASPTAAPKLAALVVLVLGPACAVLVFLLWNPERPELARGGLRVPPVRIELVGQCETIPDAQAAATTTSSAPPSTSSTTSPGGKTLSAEDRRKLRLAREAYSRQGDAE